jgi:HNH endonuclease
MRIEIILFLITAAVMANIYTDGKYLKMALTWKKYYQMAGIAAGAYVLYVLVKQNPANANNIIMTSNEYLKYLPLDKSTSSFISPILDFTGKQGTFMNGGDHPIVGIPVQQPPSRYEKQVMQSGGGGAPGKKGTKRSVSETKKKFVASRQDWKCGGCGLQLNAWFEVDHKIRLEYGGSNHIDNLVAMCRECHGQKTTMENL